MNKQGLATQFREDFLKTDTQPTNAEYEQYECIGSFELDDQDLIEGIAKTAKVISSSARCWIILFKDMSYIMALRPGEEEKASYQTITVDPPKGLKERLDLVKELSNASSEFAAYFTAFFGSGEKAKVSEEKTEAEVKAEAEAESESESESEDEGEDEEEVTAFFFDVPVIVFGVIALGAIAMLVDTSHWFESILLGVCLGALFSLISPIYHKD